MAQMADATHWRTIKENCCFVTCTKNDILPGIYALLLFKFSTYFFNFFIIRLFSRESSFLIFKKIWCSSNWKLGMLQSKNLAPRMIFFQGFLPYFFLSFPLFSLIFFIIWLFPRESSFLIFKKIWCSSNWKLGMLQSKNLA